MKVVAKIKRMFANVLRGMKDMHDYQINKAVVFLMENPFSFLLIDVGMGKTISSLTVISNLMLDLSADKVLVIGPSRVATETWPTEIGVWSHTAWMNHSLIHVSDNDPRLSLVPRHARTAEKERLRGLAARSSASIHIVPSHWVEWLVMFWGPKWPYRTVFVDESSQFKDHQSGRFKALAKVRNTPGLITRMHLLTATPAAETYMSVFAQTFLIDGGKRFGKHITHFRNEYFTENKYSRKFTLRPGAEDLILAKIADISLVMKDKDYLGTALPTVLRRPVHLDEKQLALYTKMETEYIVTLDDGAVIEAETAAALSSKLLQMASGVLYETIETAVGDDEIKRTTKVHSIHDHKIEELKQIVDELQGSPVLVSYHFKSSLDRLKKAFPKATVMDRDGKCVKPWNAGKVSMLLMHPMSGGHGLNLQAGGHHIVFFDLPWSLELYLQLIGRLARQGQKHPVIVWLLTAMGTMDLVVSEALAAKEDAQDKFFVKLRKLIRKAKKARQQAVSDENDEL